MLHQKQQAVLELEAKIEKYNIIIANAVRSNQATGSEDLSNRESLTIFRNRAKLVQDKCHAISDGILEEYSSFYFLAEYDNYRYRRDDDTTETEHGLRDSVYHNGFRQHGPTGK